MNTDHAIDGIKDAFDALTFAHPSGEEARLPLPGLYPLFNTRGAYCTLPLLFDPARTHYIYSETLFYDKASQTSHLWSPQDPGVSRAQAVDRGSLVICVKGLCRSEHTAAWAVYFGPGSELNECGVLHRADGDPPLNGMRAEAEALCRALHIISSAGRESPLLCDVIWVAITTDSSYIVSAMVEPKKPTNEYPLIEHTILSELRARVEDIESHAHNGNGVHVRFWHVSRKESGEARKLVGEALDVLNS
ncbi:hypothetical protein F4677DRAFT_402645 [Hypoxylon crocopeplum]|nr:hypothetical protein F4677DRAFT_402645 [Hypoxylon crocopeplum]